VQSDVNEQALIRLSSVWKHEFLVSFLLTGLRGIVKFFLEAPYSCGGHMMQHSAAFSHIVLSPKLIFDFLFLLCNHNRAILHFFFISHVQGPEKSKVFVGWLTCARHCLGHVWIQELKQTDLRS
jgi:hypothetical protein